MKQEHKTKEYRKVSPFAQVPALILDDGTQLTESRAICTYFEGIFPERNLMGEDPKEKALIEMWDRRVELMLFIQFATWFRNAHPAMAPLEVPQLPEVGAKAEKNARAMAKRIDAHLADNDFLAAGRFSIADITLNCFCGFAGVMQWKPHEEFANIGKCEAKNQGNSLQLPGDDPVPMTPKEGTPCAFPIFCWPRSRKPPPMRKS